MHFFPCARCSFPITIWDEAPCPLNTFFLLCEHFILGGGCGGDACRFFCPSDFSVLSQALHVAWFLSPSMCWVPFFLLDHLFHFLFSRLFIPVSALCLGMCLLPGGRDHFPFYVLRFSSFYLLLDDTLLV